MAGGRSCRSTRRAEGGGRGAGRPAASAGRCRAESGRVLGEHAGGRRPGPRRRAPGAGVRAPMIRPESVLARPGRRAIVSSARGGRSHWRADVGGRWPARDRSGGARSRAGGARFARPLGPRKVDGIEVRAGEARPPPPAGRAFGAREREGTRPGSTGVGVGIGSRWVRRCLGGVVRAAGGPTDPRSFGCRAIVPGGGRRAAPVAVGTPWGRAGSAAAGVDIRSTISAARQAAPAAVARSGVRRGRRWRRGGVGGRCEGVDGRDGRRDNCVDRHRRRRGGSSGTGGGTPTGCRGGGARGGRG